VCSAVPLRGHGQPTREGEQPRLATRLELKINLSRNQNSVHIIF
jgi:hypothetical protein